MPITVLAKNNDGLGTFLAIFGAIVALIAIVAIRHYLKQAARSKSLREVADREMWSYAKKDPQVAAELAQFRLLNRSPRNVIQFQQEGLELTLADIHIGLGANKRSSRNNTSTGQTATICQIVAPSLQNNPALSLQSKPEIPPEILKLVGTISNINPQAMLDNASLALLDDPDGFADKVMIQAADAQAARAFLTPERCAQLRPIIDAMQMVAVRPGALVIATKKPAPPEELRAFSESACKLAQMLATDLG